MYFKLKPNIICILMVLLVSSQWTFNTMIVQASGTSGYRNGTMYNEYIEYATLANGTYSIGTTGGDPSSSSDDNKPLLYGHPTNPTSYTTLRIDSSNYIFNPNLTPVVDELNLSSTSEYTIGSVKFKQIVTIVDNTSTGRRDTVQIKYIAQNTDVSLSHNVGLRIMMDINIAGNDLAPIRVPGIGIVKNELELNEDNVPSYWQAFDSSTNPNVITQGTLIKNEDGRPNKVQFVNYSSISKSRFL
jgi:hypothetical protein